MPPSGTPILLSMTEGQRRIVARCCRRAREAGVRRGMPLSVARAIFPNGAVRIEPHEPREDALALRRLAAWAQRYSPTIAIDEPDGLLIDVSGCERFFKGEDRLLDLVEQGFRSIGFTARAAIAPTFASAWSLARYAPRRSIVPEGRQRDALAPLPVRALRPAPETLDSLAEVGLERIEHLLALPRRSLASRFGEDLLLRLDLALGRAIETIEPVRLPEPFRVERLFDGPTTQWEAIELTVRELVRALCGKLATRERGARRVEAIFVRVDATPIAIAARLSRPSRDDRHLFSLLRPMLERVNLGFGIECVSLMATRTGRIRHEQREQWPGGPAGPHDDHALGELLDTLANRLGPERVTGAALAESHIPERAFQLRSVLDPARGQSAPVLPLERPTTLLDRPAPAEVMALTPDGPVMRLRWAGRDATILACIGPERIAPEWWRGDSATRDYYRVQDDSGRWLWLYLERESGRWFVHGIWA